MTYSAKLQPLAPDEIRAWILRELDRVALAHATFSDDAPALIGDGILRGTRNLCIATLLEAVRDRTRTVELLQVNRVLLQPHWRQNQDIPEAR